MVGVAGVQGVSQHTLNMIMGEKLTIVDCLHLLAEFLVVLPVYGLAS
jgi:hypothetical protein